MSARDTILKRLHATRNHAFANEADTTAEEDSASPGATIEQRMALFSEQLKSVQTEVHEVGRADWGERLLQLTQKKGASNLLYAADVEPGAEIERTWSAAADRTNLPELVAVDAIGDNWKSQLFNRIDAAVTTSRAGIAATGSLVLWPDQREPRLMSLAPPIHFALLNAENLYATFEQMLTTEQWTKTDMPTNALLISGPSKTADIESTLAYGVHGPKQLVVLLLR